MTGDDVLGSFDIMAPLDAEAHHGTTRLAREQCPVTYSEPQQAWLVTSYKDLKAVTSDPRTFSSAVADGAGLDDSVLRLDPPLHTDLRRLFDRLFTRSHLSTYADDITAVAAELVDGFADDGRCEVIADLAMPLTSAVLATVVFGLNFSEHREELLHTSRAVAAVVQSSASGVSEEELGQVVQTIQMIVARRMSSAEEAPDDFLNALLTGTVNGKPLTPEQVMAHVLLFLGAGLDTTKAAIGNVVYRISQDPRLEDDLRRSSDDTDWDEFLRLDSPIVALPRSVTKPTALNGRDLAPGDRVLLCFGSANRDETVFDDADELVMDRPRNPHVAFGSGIHRCIGSHLARMEMKIAIEQLLARVANVRVIEPEHLRYAPGTVRHYAELPIAFDPLPSPSG